MSIETQITRLQNAKTAIKTALINKGVEVSENAKIDEYSELINGIQTGADLSEIFSNSYNGAFQTGLLKIPDLIDTSSATTMYGFFQGCRLISEIPNINTSKATNFRETFSGCWKLTEIPQLDTSSATTFENMFYNCKAINTIPQLDASKVTNVQYMFSMCSNLESLGGLINLGSAFSPTQLENSRYHTLDLSACTKLTHESLMNVINNLYDIASKGCNKQKLNLGATNLAKLTDEEIAIATTKGWNVT